MKSILGWAPFNYMHHISCIMYCTVIELIFNAISAESNRGLIKNVWIRPLKIWVWLMKTILGRVPFDHMHHISCIIWYNVLQFLMFNAISAESNWGLVASWVYPIVLPQTNQKMGMDWYGQIIQKPYNYMHHYLALFDDIMYYIFWCLMQFQQKVIEGWLLRGYIQ